MLFEYLVNVFYGVFDFDVVGFVVLVLVWSLVNVCCMSLVSWEGLCMVFGVVLMVMYSVVLMLVKVMLSLVFGGMMGRLLNVISGVLVR